MDPTGLIDKIYTAAAAIDFGRKGFATRGKAEEGRLSYEQGISIASSTFRDAQSTADPEIIIIVEYTFLAQELQFAMKPIQTVSAASPRLYRALTMLSLPLKLSKIPTTKLLTKPTPTVQSIA